MKQKLLFVFLVLCIFTGVNAADLVTISAEYTYYAPENVSLEQARQTALVRARLKGLADEFGMVIIQDITTFVENINGQTSSNVLQQSFSNVKGEWIKDVEEPKYDVSCQNNMLIVHVMVKFKAREIKRAAIDIDVKVLRNGTDDRDESDTFNSGNSLYLSFLSPKSGYVAVFQIVDDTAYCLLPYSSQTDGVFQVKGNKRYVFFSEKEDSNAEEYMMYTDKETEHNVIYVIFSPNEFSKAADRQSDEKVGVKGSDGFPRELPIEKFNKWLTKQRTHDDKMVTLTKTITIRK